MRCLGKSPAPAFQTQCVGRDRGKDTTGFAKNTGTETREKQLPFRDKYKLRPSELGVFRLVTTVGKMVEG